MSRITLSALAADTWQRQTRSRCGCIAEWKWKLRAVATWRHVQSAEAHTRGTAGGEGGSFRPAVWQSGEDNEEAGE